MLRATRSDLSSILEMCRTAWAKLCTWGKNDNWQAQFHDVDDLMVTVSCDSSRQMEIPLSSIPFSALVYNIRYDRNREICFELHDFGFSSRKETQRYCKLKQINDPVTSQALNPFKSIT